MKITELSHEFFFTTSLKLLIEISGKKLILSVAVEHEYVIGIKKKQ